MTLAQLVMGDIRAKAEWNYERSDWKALLRTLATDGTAAMVLYRLMQWSVRRHLTPFAFLFNKLNTVFNNCIIGCGASFVLVWFSSTRPVLSSTTRFAAALTSGSSTR